MTRHVSFHNIIYVLYSNQLPVIQTQPTNEQQHTLSPTLLLLITTCSAFTYDSYYVYGTNSYLLFAMSNQQIYGFVSFMCVCTCAVLREC